MNITESILSQLKKYEQDGDPVRNRIHGAPTWWFKFDIPFETDEIRKELKRLERNGVVVKTNSSRRGQSQWSLL